MLILFILIYGIRSVNLLRDGGTFAYNSSPEDLATFPEFSHNTIQFDGGEPVPRLEDFFGVTGYARQTNQCQVELCYSLITAVPMDAINARLI